MNQEKLIFIVSLPRSGSTLLQALLSNHSNVTTANEPWLLFPFIGYTQKDLFLSRVGMDLINEGINGFIYKSGGNEMYKKEVQRFILSLYQNLNKNENKYVLDKTPRYYEILNEIREFFPKAKIIVLKRHPLAVLNSIKNTWASSPNKLHPFYSDLISGPKLINEFLKSDPNSLCVKYEDLVENPLSIMTDIYNYVGLIGTPNLNYSENNTFKGGFGDFHGINNHNFAHIKSINSWKGLFNNRKWKMFAKGYMNSLSEGFLKEYGDYEYIRSKKTKAFESFSFFGKYALHKPRILKYKLIKYYLKKYISF